MCLLREDVTQSCHWYSSSWDTGSTKRTFLLDFFSTFFSFINLSFSRFDARFARSLFTEQRFLPNNCSRFSPRLKMRSWETRLKTGKRYQTVFLIMKQRRWRGKEREKCWTASFKCELYVNKPDNKCTVSSNGWRGIHTLPFLVKLEWSLFARFQTSFVTKVLLQSFYVFS